ncbi:unnamed protein product [Protopolystoma xenopodis]|uniref:Uncharacterized protein n=1 Tax=Protopolystoma xenopodis TaxID=117903 RepID=A0A448X990_9PLAT|nr:unnamed protein product [Protopolystoma xenopodis]
MPYEQSGPFRGYDIEQATEQEYASGFDCLKVSWREVLPQETGLKENLERRRRSVRGTEVGVEEFERKESK